MEQIIPFILAFFGGVFGSLVGGATSFIIFGFLGIIGIGLAVATGSEVFLNDVALSPLFAPHTAFAGGVAAAAYMGKQSRKNVLTADLDAGADPLEPFIGGDIFTPLSTFGNTGSLIVGGIFGVLGFGILYVLDNVIGLQADNLAVAVVITNIIARLAFGDADMMSDLPEETNKMGMVTNNLVFNILWSFALAVIMANIIGVIQIPLFGFVLGAFGLIFIVAGIDFPMIHHVALIGGMAMQVFGNIWIAGIFGVIAMLLCEFIGVYFNANAKSHIDPPATAIVVISLILLNVF